VAGFFQRGRARHVVEVGDRGFPRARDVLLQRDDPENGNDADEDERALEEPCGHIPQCKLFALAPDDRVDHDRMVRARDRFRQRQVKCFPLFHYF